MEPITTAWMISTLLGGWLGNRSDSLLCKGTNSLYRRITSRIDEPANHHIQRAVRKSYLQATHMAVTHVLQDHSKLALLDQTKTNLTEIKSYVEVKLNTINKDSEYIRQTVLDTEHQELLFPSQNQTSQQRKAETIENFKQSVIDELERKRLRVPLKLKEVIMNGWKEKSKQHDFYGLTSAFFTQELKENNELSTFIQTEYLDHISKDTRDIKVDVSDLRVQIEPLFHEYKEFLPALNKILDGINALQTGQENIKDSLQGIPQKTAEIILSAVNSKVVTQSLSVSQEYQRRIKKLNELEGSVDSIRNQISGIETALTQVDNNTQKILQQNLSSLEIDFLEKDNEKLKQEKSLNDWVAELTKLANHLQEKEYSDSARIEKAKQLFSEGKFEEINSVLNEKDIDEEIRAFKEKGNLLVNELTLKAQATLLNKQAGWFEEVDRLYSKAISIIENYETTFKYANFLAEHNILVKAAEQFQNVLQHCSNEKEKASVLNNLAKVQRNQNEFEKAEQSIHEALEIIRKLIEINPQTYLPYLAMTLKNSANIEMSKNDFAKAEQSYLEALEIYKKLVEVNPQAHLPDLGMTLNNFAVLQSNKHEFHKAEQSYLEALEIIRKLAKVNPQAHLPDLGMTLNNLALLQSAKNELDKAEQSYKEALGIYGKLAKVNPQTYLPNFGTLINNLATLQYRKNKFENAEQSYLEALEIYRKLAEINPQAYLPDLAMTLSNYAILLTDKNDFQKAEQSHLEALDTYRKLANVNSQTYLPDVAITLNNLAILRSNKHEFENAEQSYLEALEIYRKLVEVNPQTHLPDLALTLNNLANLRNNKHEFNKAEQSYLEALEVYRKLMEVNPQTHLPYLGMTLNNLAVLQSNNHKFEKAEQSYLEALEIRRKLAKVNPHTYLPDLGMTLNNLANLQSAKNEFDKAEQSYKEALDIYRKLARVIPEVYEISLANTYLSLGVFYLNAKALKEKSIEFTKLAIALFEKYWDNNALANKNGDKALSVLQHWKKCDDPID